MVPILVGRVSLPSNLTVAVFLALRKLTHELRPIVILAMTLALDLAVAELASVFTAVAHQQDTLAILLPLRIVSLILEERVAECVDAVSMAKFHHGVDTAHVAVLGQLVLGISIHHGCCPILRC